jgi:hypothetical protein
MFNPFKRPPSRNELIDAHWLEYLQWIKDHDEKRQARPSERGFWKWYVATQMEVTFYGNDATDEEDVEYD